MQTIINFVKKYGSIVTISLITLLIICAFVCCLTQVIAKIGVFMGTCGIIGTIFTLVMCTWLLIQEVKTAW